MAEGESGKVFSECHVAVVPSRGLPVQNALVLQTELESNGATISELKADGTIKLGEVTHIISATFDFPQYSLACEHMISVVRPNWITASLIKNKQMPIRPYTPDPRLVFSGVSLTCADIPTGDKDAIIGAVMAMGGQESSSLSKLVTHIVALTMDNPKCQSALEKRLKCKIVLPHWFDDCFKLGKRIDEKPYLLPDPEILRKRSDEDVKVPSTAHIEGAMTPRPNFLPTPTDSPTGSDRKLNVFHEKKVMLADDLGLSSRLRGIIEDLIEGGGGSITTSAEKANMYVCQYRDGGDYTRASRRGIDVGNLSWLYHLITHNEWTSPFRRLLHYPLPKTPIKGFENARITLSNYGGEARIYLENLVQACGGDFTKSMKQDNTHLITARNTSEKCDAASEWNIPMVNHLWIEESYAKCQAQALTNPRYTHFPSRTNLGEVIGQTQFDRSALERVYFPHDNSESPNIRKASRAVMKDKDQNSTVAKKNETLPVEIAGEEPAEPEDAELPILPPPKSKKSRESATPVRVAHAMSTPYANRLVGIGKENETPSSASSRGAKDRALSKLHDLAPDMALYEKEKKRANGGVWGGKRAANQIDKSKIQKGQKRASSPADEDADVASSDEEDRESKRLKTGLPTIQMRLLITGYRRWVDAPAKEEAERKKLRELGILIVQEPTGCTHIAAPAVVRTQKFLCAIASGVPVISAGFVDTCLAEGFLQPIEKFELKDKENEKRFNVKLKDVVKRAKANARHLLNNIPIYCTAEITNGAATFESIVRANGGEFSIYRGRAGTLAKSYSPADQPEPVYLLSGNKQDEKKLWPKFNQMATENGHEPRIVTTEWLLDTAMSQELLWNPKYLQK